MLAVDLDGRHNPDLSLWASLGLGRGVDASLGLDVPAGLMIGGPWMLGAPAGGVFPGLAVRKTFDTGMGVGVGSSTRLLFLPADSSAAIPRVSTAGLFVTVATPAGQAMQGRATMHIGYAEVRRPNAATTTRGLAVHVAGQGGPVMALGDTARVVAGARAHAGTFVWPQRGRVHGPAVGLTVQAVGTDPGTDAN